MQCVCSRRTIIFRNYCTLSQVVKQHGFWPHTAAGSCTQRTSMQAWCTSTKDGLFPRRTSFVYRCVYTPWFQIPILVKFTRGYDCIHCTYTCCNNIWKVRCCKRSRSLEVFVRVRRCKSARRKVVKPIKRSRVDGELQEPDANQSPRPGYQEGYSCRVQRAQSLSLRG